MFFYPHRGYPGGVLRWCKKKGLTSCPPCRLERRGKTNSKEVVVGNDVTADKAIRQALTLGIDRLCDRRLYLHHGVLTTTPYE